MRQNCTGPLHEGGSLRYQCRHPLLDAWSHGFIRPAPSTLVPIDSFYVKLIQLPSLSLAGREGKPEQVRTLHYVRNTSTRLNVPSELRDAHGGGLRKAPHVGVSAFHLAIIWWR